MYFNNRIYEMSFVMLRYGSKTGELSGGNAKETQ